MSSTTSTSRTFEMELQKDFADSILSGDLTFIVHDNDKGYQKGDLIAFKAVDHTGFMHKRIYGHPINDKLFEITYVSSGYGIREGFVALCIREVSLKSE